MHHRRIALLATLLSVSLTVLPCRGNDTMDKCVSAYEQAQRLRKEEDLIGSRKELQTCLYPRCPRVLRKDCKRWLQEVETATPSFLIEARDPEGHEAVIQVSLDGKPIVHMPGTPIEVNPGPHVFEVQSGDVPATTYRVVARAGEQNRRLHVVIPPDIPEYVWLLTGAGAANLTSAGYFFIRAHRADEADAVHMANTAAGVSLGIALLSLGAAGWAYWKRPRTQWTEPDCEEPEPEVGVVVQPGAAMLGVSGRF